jgi:hypothetical protein
VSTIAHPIEKRAPVSWRPPVIWIAVTHMLVPALLLWRAPADLLSPGGWVGAALLVSELLALAFTASVVARPWSLERGAERGLIALLVFLCLPSVVLTYLGLARSLSLASVLIATGAAEIVLLTLARTDEVAPRGETANWDFGLGFVDRYLFALAVLSFAVLALNAIRYTPADSDTMWYHLPMVAEWIKTKSIAPLASVPLMARGYPGARETILIWLSLPMVSDNLAFLSLVEVPGTCLAIYGICREFEVSRALSLALAGLFATTPEVSMWTSSQKNDLFLALAFLLAIFFTMRWLRTGLVRYVLLAGLSTGLLCATKLSGPAYAGLLAAMLTGTLVLRRKTERPAIGARTIALVLTCMIVVAGPWYVRNLASFHNPVFPKQVLVLGRTLFAGPLDASFFAPITLGLNFPRLLTYWKQFFDGFGPALPVLLAAPLLLLALFCWRRRWQIKAETLLWLAALPALLLIVYMVQPFSLLPRGVNSFEVQPRFLFPLMACLHVTLGFVLSRVPGAARFRLPMLALLGLGNLIVWTHYWWLVGALALVAAITIPVVAKAPYALAGFASGVRQHPSAVLVVAFLAATVASHRMDGFRERIKDLPEYGYIGSISPGWGEVSLYVRHNISNKRILFLGRPEDFPLYGRGYTNDLYTTDDRYAMEFLESNHVDYVVAFRSLIRHGAEGQTWQYFPAATEDLRKRYPEKFQLVYTASGAEIVKVLE